MEQRNAELSKLEKSLSRLAFRSLAAGISVGGAVSYITKNPDYVMYGTLIGVGMVAISGITFMLYLSEKD